MKKKARSWVPVLLILLIVGVVIGTAAYLERGWLRASFIPAYAAKFYKPAVDKNFDKNFGPVNNQLESLGFSFNRLLQDQCFKGDDVSFEGFRETVSCIKQQESEPFTLTPEFIKNWQQKSPQLEAYLQYNGWQKNTKQQSINGIFSVPGYRETIGVNYVKLAGKTYCNVSINYTANATDPNKVWVDETCARAVSFFGSLNG